MSNVSMARDSFKNIVAGGTGPDGRVKTTAGGKTGLAPFIGQTVWNTYALAVCR